MRYLAVIILAYCFSQPSTKTYRFIGKFKSASVLEGSGDYVFTGLTNEEKHFAYDIVWKQELPYEFFDEIANTSLNHVDKWFIITYHGEYGNLSGDDSEKKRWYRKIDSIGMIGVPLSHSLITACGSFKQLESESSVMIFNKPNGDLLEISFDLFSLRGLPSDFVEHANDQYVDRVFEIRYRNTYEIESTSAVVNRLHSIKLKTQ